MAINDVPIKPSLQQTQQVVPKQGVQTAIPAGATVAATLKKDDGNAVSATSAEKETSSQKSLDELQEKVS